MNRLNRFCTTLACISIIAACSTAFAYTIDTGFITFVQPNGVEFVGRQWSEGYVVKNRTDDGFEFIKGPEGYYYYAKLDERGDFTPSEFKVGIDDPVTNGIARGLNRTAERRAQIQDALERSASVTIPVWWNSPK